VQVPISLGTNIASLGAQRKLGQTTNELGLVYERLASGSRINHAADDAAGLAISSSLNSQGRVFNRAILNLNDGISALNIADQAVGNLGGIVTRQRELAQQAANGIYTDNQRTALDNEAQALASEYARIIQTTKFNDRKLIDGSETGIALQGGYGANGIINANIFNLSPGSSSSISNTTDLGTTTDSTINFNSAPYSDLSTASNGFLTGDMNGDGITDIISLSLMDNAGTNKSNVSVQIFLGKASGGYSTPDAATASHIITMPDTVDTNTISGQIGDFNADGKIDLRISVGVTDVSLGFYSEFDEFRNTTVGGTFSMNMTFTRHNAPTSPTLITGSTTGDFNGDGIADDLVDNNDGTFSIKIHNTSTTTTTTTTPSTIDNLNLSSFSLTTQSNARAAMSILSDQSDELSQVRGKIGASLSRLNSATSVLQSISVNYAAANNRISDADVGQDSAELARLGILRTASSAVLAQANLQPSIALKLLQI